MMEGRSIVKTLLGDDNDEKIAAIKELTEDRLRVLLSLPLRMSDEGELIKPPIPASLEYIVTEVTVRRFNRIGSEGLSSHTVEGETMTWPDDDFEPYNSDIQAFLDAQEDPSSKRGRVRFL